METYNNGSFFEFKQEIEEELEYVENKIEDIHTELALLEDRKTELIIKRYGILPSGGEDYDHFNSISYEIELIDEEIFHLSEQKETLVVEKDELNFELEDIENISHDEKHRTDNIESKSIDKQRVNYYFKLVRRKQLLIKEIESMKQEVVEFIKINNGPILHNDYIIRLGQYKRYKYSKEIEIAEKSIKKAKAIEIANGIACLEQITAYPIVCKKK